jgi:hypothetical protein
VPAGADLSMIEYGGADRSRRPCARQMLNPALSSAF